MLTPVSRLFVILALFSSAVASAQARDAQALAVIFGDEATVNVLELRRQVARESGVQRYQRLLHAVLPPQTDSIRIDIDFTPTHPAPPVAARQVDTRSAGHRDCQSGPRP